MSIGKREVTLLIILGLLLYGFLFYSLILQSFIPDFKDANQKLTEAQQKEKALKEDLKNIDQLRLQYNSKSVQNERMEGYLLSSADITDCIEYMDKLAKMVGKQFRDVKLVEPQEKNVGPKTVTKVENDSDEDVGSANNTETSDTSVVSPKPAEKSAKYYELAMSFKASLSYDEVSSLINYIEGGSRRIRVSKFKMEAPKATDTGTAAKAKTAADATQYDIDMELNIYSEKVGNLDKLYDYGRHRFNNYIKGNGLQFEGMPEIVTASASSAGASAGAPSGASKTAYIPLDISSKADIILIESGYLTTGDNLRIYGINKTQDVLGAKTNKRADVYLVLSGASYTITAPNNLGKTSSITGRLPDGDLDVDMTVSIPNIKENEKISLNFKVVNNTTKKINVKLSDSGSRAKILDRSGAQIRSVSKKENLSIL
jgi:hypothetical protein